jgi:hypothetical protein
MNTALPVPSDELCAALEDRVLEMNGRGRVLFAYTATMDRGAYALSIVIDGVTGHYPLPERFAFGDETTMQAVAEHLNRERLHLPANTVTGLVLRSMRSEGRRAAR